MWVLPILCVALHPARRRGMVDERSIRGGAPSNVCMRVILPHKVMVVAERERSLQSESSIVEAS